MLLRKRRQRQWHRRQLRTHLMMQITSVIKPVDWWRILLVMWWRWNSEVLLLDWITRFLFDVDYRRMSLLRTWRLR